MKIRFAVALLAAASAVVAQDDAGAPSADAPKIASPAPFIDSLCTHLSSTNPRVRYTAREGLVNFGAQGMLALRKAREGATDPHVQAFIDRVIARVKLRTLRPAGRSALSKPRSEEARAAREAFAAAIRNRPKFDVDRIAMDITLTFEQIAKLEPILTRHFGEVDAMWREVKELGATRDKEAYKALNEEIGLLVEKAEPKLRAFLDEKQTKYVLRLMKRRYGGAFSSYSLRAREAEMKDRARALEEAIRAKEEAMKRKLEKLGDR